MDDWREVGLAELGELNRGKSRHRPRNASHLYGGPYPFIQTGDIKEAGGRVTAYSQTYSEAGLAQSRLWPAGTVVITIAANIAETAILTFPACFPDSVVGFAANPARCDARFIEYKFQVLRRQIQGEHVGTGSVQDNINLAILNRLKLLVPPVEQQRAIADLLGSLDDKIELNRRMNETLEAMAQAIFRDWFVDFGPTQRKIEGATDPVEIMGGIVTEPGRADKMAKLFPGAFGGNGLPEGWEAEPLLEQAQWVNGAAYKNMHFSDAADALPVVKIAELKSGVTASTKRTNSELGERYRISVGELLFSWSGNPDTSIDAFIWTGGKAWLNQHIFAVRQNGKLSRSSLYILLKWLNPQFAEIARNKQTTGLGHVTKEDMRRLLVCVAPRDVEAAFADLAEPMIELLISRLFEINTLAATRDLLLPKLMSGEIRLDDARELAEKAA